MKYIINSSLSHHGILGQKWGVRRYQNEDGSLTPRGQKRQLKQELNKENKTRLKNILSPITSNDSTSKVLKERNKVKLATKYVEKYSMNNTDALKKAKATQRNRAIAYTTAVIGTLSVATLLGYKNASKLV